MAQAHPLLVVDDEQRVRMLISKALSRSGYDVTTTATFGEALECLGEREYGTVLVDKNLAEEKSGLDLIRHLAEHHPKTKSIMLTGYATVESAIEAVRLGAFDYITKPFDLKELRSKVAAATRAFSQTIERDTLLMRHESLFETIPGLVWFMTEGGRLMRINDGGAAALGYTPGELQGEQYSVLLQPDDQSLDVEWALKERRTGVRSTRRQLVPLVSKSGEVRSFEVYSTGAYVAGDSADFRGTVGVAHDVTEVLAMHDAMIKNQRIESLGRFAGEIAHDFNNVLMVVSGSCELLEDSLDGNAEARQDLTEIRKAAELGAELVQRLLAFHRAEESDPTDIDFAKVVSGMEPMLRRLVHRRIRLKFEVDPRCVRITADRVQLEQVLMNLVVNAKDAMPDVGDMTISVTTTESDGHGGLPFGRFATLAVTDSGTGMTAEEQKRAFEPFFSTKGDGRGSGLGLATSYRIVHKHGGRISIESTVGSGTRVTVHIPESKGSDGAKPDAT